jgi:hypothetical protein
MAEQQRYYSLFLHIDVDINAISIVSVDHPWSCPATHRMWEVSAKAWMPGADHLIILIIAGCTFGNFSRVGGVAGDFCGFCRKLEYPTNARYVQAPPAEVDMLTKK